MPIAPFVAPAGMVTFTCELLTTVTATFLALPIHAWFAPVNPLPLIVTTVPTGPELGAKFVMPGWT